jgi:hypothetical protein
MATKKKITPRKRQRRKRESGGLSTKRDYYIDVDTGEKVSYTCYHASREVDPKHLPAGANERVPRPWRVLPEQLRAVSLDVFLRLVKLARSPWLTAVVQH